MNTVNVNVSGGRVQSASKASCKLETKFYHEPYFNRFERESKIQQMILKQIIDDREEKVRERNKLIKELERNGK